MIKVCFYHPAALPILDPNAGGRFGGAQLRAVLLAQELARRDGFRVQLLVQDYGELDLRRRFGRLDVVVNSSMRKIVADTGRRGFRESAGRLDRPPWVSVHRIRLGLAWQIPVLGLNRLLSRYLKNKSDNPDAERIRPFLLRGVDAVCIFQGGRNVCEMVSRSRRERRKTVLFVTGDSQLWCRDLEQYRDVVDYSAEEAGRWEYLLTHADQIVVQTCDQQQMLRERFGREGVLIRNPVEIDATGTPANHGNSTILWIGRADLTHKRSHRLLELARRCPDLPFVAIMNRWRGNLWQEMLRAAPPNLRIIERVSPNEVSGWLRRSALLVNTSASEGFPNAFLQAAALGVPVVSLRVDPDGFCARHGCGVQCDDNIDRMAAELCGLWRNTGLRDEIGRRASEYVRREHDVREKGDQLAGLLRELCSS